MHQIVFSVMLNGERLQAVLQREAGVAGGLELGIGDIEAVVHAGLGGWVCGVEVFYEFAEPDSFKISCQQIVFKKKKKNER